MSTALFNLMFTNFTISSLIIPSFSCFSWFLIPVSCLLEALPLSVFTVTFFSFWSFLFLFLRAPFLNNYCTGPTLASFLHHKVYSSLWGGDAMTCSHDIHLVRRCVLSLCFVLLHHVLHFLILYLSLFLTSFVRLILLKEKEHYQYIMISRRMSLKNM